MVRLSLVHATVALAWLCDSTVARRRGRPPLHVQGATGATVNHATAPAVVPEEVRLARQLIEEKRFNEAEQHIRAQLPLAAGRRSRAVDELQMLHGLALFELTRWGEAVLALRRAVDGGSNQAVRARTEAYLAVASKAMTHTMFDTIAHRMLQLARSLFVWCMRVAVIRQQDTEETAVCGRRMPAQVYRAAHIRAGLSAWSHNHTGRARHVAATHRRGTRLDDTTRLAAALARGRLQEYISH